MKAFVPASVVILSSVFAIMLGGCEATPKDEGKAVSLAADTQAAITSFKAKDPSIQPLLNKSVGYVVFPNIGKAGWILGGSYGKGEVFDRDGAKIGYADISEVSAGFQWGAQNFSEMLIFMKQSDLDSFKSSEFALGANVSAVALSAGAAGTTDPSKGVIALVDTKGGLMAEAAVGGQRIRFRSN